MTETQLEIIKYFFENTDCNDTAKRFASHLITEVELLQKDRDFWRSRYYESYKRGEKHV